MSNGCARCQFGIVDTGRDLDSPLSVRGGMDLVAVLSSHAAPSITKIAHTTLVLKSVWHVMDVDTISLPLFFRAYAVWAS